MAARLDLDTCRHHHDADPVLGFADATIIATGDAVGSSMAARLGLDTCRHHHDAQPVLGFADATIIATGDAVATTLLKGFDAYAAAVAETIRTLDGRYVSKKHHTLLPRGENYLHGLSDHVSGLLVAASRCAAEPPLFPEADGCVQIKFLRRVRTHWLISTQPRASGKSGCAAAHCDAATRRPDTWSESPCK